MSKQSIILYNPQSSASRKPVLPMALLALGATLEGAFDYRIVDGNLQSIEDLDREIREMQAGVVGITVMGGPQLRHAVIASRAIRERHPEVSIVWGGYFPTQHAEVCLRSEYVDFVVRGHADFTFPEFLRALGNGDRDAAAEIGMRHAPVPDPDRLPTFPYHRVDMQRYVRRTFMGERTLPHHSSYGCPFRCNFCAVVNMVDGRWIAQSAERTAEVVRTLIHRWGADSVEFYDNNFFVSEKRTAEFAERIRNFGIHWWGEARIDTMLKFGEPTWRLLRDSGLRMVFLGAESGSDETLKRMNKGGTASADRTLEIAAKMREYGVVPEFSFVLGNPPEPEKDIEETLSFIRRLKRINPAAETVLYMYTPVPLAGELYDRARERGFRFPETLEEWAGDSWQAFAQRRSANIPWVGDRLRRRVRNFERVLNAYYPTVTDARLRGFRRTLLRAAGSWRYQTQTYGMPVELLALQKLFAYQRPETSGF